MIKKQTISIAVVGRPNVGKSTLFNRLIKQRKAIETDVAGTTRDRLYGDFVWRGKQYEIIDTAGLLYQNLDEIESEAQKSTQIAMEQADVILFVVDYKQGVADIDLEIAKTLRRHARAILVVNKCDSEFNEEKLLPYKRLGFGHMALVSAISGRNSGDLLDLIDQVAHDLGGERKTVDRGIKQFSLSFIGRPNAGKSTLLNTIMGEEKMIVSKVAGTTRDSQEFSFDHKGYRINLIDTAGIQRKSRVRIGSIDGYALLRSYRAINDSDILVYILDASEGVVSFDQSLLGKAKDSGKSIVLAVNKIDLWEDKDRDMAQFIGLLQEELNFMPWLPVVFISAKDKTNVENLLNQTVKVIEEREIEISQSECDQLLREAVELNGQIDYISFLTYERSKPVVFKIKTKKNKKPHFSHLRYLENRIRDHYPLSGSPLYIDWQKKTGKN